MDNVITEKLTKELAISKSKEILEIIHENPGEFWGEKELLYELPLKFEKSVIVNNDNRLIGFIIASKKSEDTLHIHKINIISELQSRGLGGIILREFLKENSEFSVSLKVHKLNSAAIKFYEKLNFDFVGLDEDHYSYIYKNKGD